MITPYVFRPRGVRPPCARRRAAVDLPHDVTGGIDLLIRTQTMLPGSRADRTSPRFRSGGSPAYEKAAASMSRW
jgi:hypothetical protein